MLNLSRYEENVKTTLTIKKIENKWFFEKLRVFPSTNFLKSTKQSKFNNFCTLFCLFILLNSRYCFTTKNLFNLTSE